VVIAHRLETITGVDTILVLSDGRVVERGDHQQLLAAGGRYAALWHAQHTSALEPR
jgi:ATP-binding cassette subfamily B protein